MWSRIHQHDGAFECYAWCKVFPIHSFILQKNYRLGLLPVLDVGDIFSTNMKYWAPQFGLINNCACPRQALLLGELSSRQERSLQGEGRSLLS